MASDGDLLGFAGVADGGEGIGESLHTIAQRMKVAPCDPSPVARCAMGNVGLTLVQL